VIIVIGSINLDLIADVERIPSPGETISGESFKTAPGGKGANQALAAARAGAPTQMIGGVGKDGFAKQATELMLAGGVDMASVRESHAATGVALILVDRSGENIIAVVPGANGSVVPGDFAHTGFTADDVVLLQHEIRLETVEAALDAARAGGATSILNTAPFRQEAAAFIDKADLIIANETEFDLYAKALKLAGADRIAQMQAFAQKSGRTIIVTLGGDGVIAVTPDEMHKVAALKIKPVDTVGAGDTFCGYLAAGLHDGLALPDALRRAAAAGSLACLKPGAQPAIPMAKEVDQALA